MKPPIMLRAAIYMALAALPVPVAWLSDVVKQLLEGKPPLLHWAVWSLLICNMIYQAVLALLAQQSGALLILGSFGASCVLVFGFIESPFAQPRNVIVGHVLCSFVGLVFLKLCGPQPWALGLALGIAVMAMLATVPSVICCPMGVEMGNWAKRSGESLHSRG